MTAHDDSTQGCPCACCPQFQQLLDWADQLDQIAVEIERDRWAYLEAKADIAENGWESDYARIGIAQYRDPTLPITQMDAAAIQYMDELPAEVIFAEDLTPYMLNNDIARPRLVAMIRERATNARDLGERGMAYCADHPDYIGREGDPVLDYFCTLDPDLVNQEVWNELFKIGYIDRPTWEDVSFEVISEAIFRAELGLAAASVVYAWRGMLAALTRFLSRMGRTAGHKFIRLTGTQIRRLNNLGQRRVPNTVQKKSTLRRGPRYGPDAADAEAGVMNGFMGIGYPIPYSQMSANARQAFQHSYTRKLSDFNLPPWAGGRAEELRVLFNQRIAPIREQAHTVMISQHKYGVRGFSIDGIPTRMTEFRATINGQEFYYYELRDIGKFVSAGLVR